MRKNARVENFITKLEVLIHYGKPNKNRMPMCCWDKCKVDDLDMLSLDHINNDGAAHRKALGKSGSSDMYANTKRKGLPEGFQTMCLNHQMKKEILRRRNGRELGQ